ncbi:MAG: hypothetical protein K2I30_05625 [Clostridia bacterium]|nr:hypothetical protein [Clostridia bacterium]
MILWKLFGYFAGQVPALAVLVSPFLWLWIGALIGAAILSVLLIIKEFRKHKGE